MSELSSANAESENKEQEKILTPEEAEQWWKSAFTGRLHPIRYGIVWPQALPTDDFPTVETLDGNKEWHCSENLAYHPPVDMSGRVLISRHESWLRNNQSNPSAYNNSRDYNSPIHHKNAYKFHRESDKPALILSNGDQEWYKYGKRHRENDQPAIVRTNGTKEWWVDGKPSRGNSEIPTRELVDGTKEWYADGVLHRYGDLPAIEHADGGREWYLYGQHHRDVDEPAVDLNNGRKEWYVFGKLHRDEDLPAIELANGTKVWYKNGLKHRDNDLPAVELADGTREWHYNGKPHRDGGMPAVHKVIVNRNNKTYDEYWYVGGKLHRDDDLPAIELTDGTREYHICGFLHRDGDLPAISRPDTKLWYQNNQLHRDGDQPASIDSTGRKVWYQRGKMHRDGISPAIVVHNILPPGNTDYYKHGTQYNINRLKVLYARLRPMARWFLKRWRMRKIKRVKWIHGELLCRPAVGHFPGGLDYQEMLSWFNKL